LAILEDVVDDELSKEASGKPSPALAEQAHGFGELRAYVPADLLDVSFPVSVRGYERRAVDAYIERVNRVIAELKVRGSPPAAVRHALDQAGEKVQGLLGAAREAAEEITASARREAEESLARAKAEAAELVVNTSAETDRLSAEAEELIAKARTEAEETIAKARAEAEEVLAEASAEAQNTRARSQAEAEERLQRSKEELAALREQAETRMGVLQADTEAVWKERRELLAGIRATASSLVELSDAAAARFPGQGLAEPEELLAAEPGAKPLPPGVAPAASTRATPADASREGGNDQSRDEAAERAGSGADT
jgi:DivIVA domain-containing protein